MTTPGAPPGHQRRPHPRQLSSRLRFWPAAINSPSMFPFSKQWFDPNLTLAHGLFIRLSTVVAPHKIQIGFIEMTFDRPPLLTLSTFGFKRAGVADARIRLIDDNLLGVFGFPPWENRPVWTDVVILLRIVGEAMLAKKRG